jgi:hypothetical protein
VQITVASSPQHAEFLLPDSVTGIDFDPDHYILCKYETFYGVEELVNNEPLYNNLRINMNPSTAPCITYALNQTGPVKIALYDISGRVQHILYNGVRSPGVYQIPIRDVPAGIYFCRMSTPVNDRVEKLIKIK